MVDKMSPPCCSAPGLVQCPTPDILDTISAIPVLCSNPLCWQSGLMHPDCFFKWEDKLVRFLLSGEREGSSTDAKVRNSLWTKHMWDLPLPTCLIACQCGDGSLKRKYGEKSSDRGLCQSSYWGDDEPEEGKEEMLYDDYENLTLKETPEDIWETVSRSKSKKKLNIQTNYQKKTLDPHHKQFKNKTNYEHLLGETTECDSGQADGRRDSSGLIHCYSCKTVHCSLPDFIKHCKTELHGRMLRQLERVSIELQEEMKGNKERLELRREVEQLKRNVLEVMRLALEQEKLTAINIIELRKNVKFELINNSRTLAILIEQFQEMAEKVFEVEDKFSFFSLMVHNNEQDLDSCFDSLQELNKKMSGVKKDVRGVLQEKDYVYKQDMVKCMKIQGKKLSSAKEQLTTPVDLVKPEKHYVNNSLSCLALIVIIFGGFVIFSLLLLSFERESLNLYFFNHEIM